MMGKASEVNFFLPDRIVTALSLDLRMSQWYMQTLGKLDVNPILRGFTLSTQFFGRG